MTARIKVLAEMDISEKRKPQDGRFMAGIGGREVDFRVSSLPTNHGEKVVLRIFDASRQQFTFSSLGLSDASAKELEALFNLGQGMVLVTGPTGSGKSTLLYTLIHRVKDRPINIVTIENPIELDIDGVAQTQINEKAGLTFATVLRSVLRQDPNVIMVGEIRDVETAEVAFRAAQTGHLVLSTLHTNSAVATVTRLLDMGIEPQVVSSSTLAIVAQRLVPLICPDCREEFRPPADFPVEIPREIEGTTTYRGEGCSSCAFTGNKGRTGIYEILRLTPPIVDAINSRKSEAELGRIASQSGMRFISDECTKLIAQGGVSLEGAAEFLHSPFADDARCPSCDEAIRPDYVACPYCGYNLTAEAQGGVMKLEPPAAPGIPQLLVVDDEPIMRDAVKFALQQIECEVKEANDGLEALSIVQRSPPDLILSDINMPNMDGFELCRQLRRKMATTFIPFIMLTSRDSAEDKLTGFTQGTDDYITKPFHYKDLQARVKRLLSRTYA